MRNFISKKHSNKRLEICFAEKRFEFTFTDSKHAKAFNLKISRSLSTSLVQTDDEDETSRHGTSLANLSGIKTEKKNILSRLLIKRPSRENLEEKGILKNEPIFGNTLTKIYETSDEPIPKFVKLCVGIIERPENIKSLGIYRTSGNMATIQKVRLAVDNCNFNILEKYSNECDVISGSLKLFFRESREQLIPKEAFQQFMAIIGM